MSVLKTKKAQNNFALKSNLMSSNTQNLPKMLLHFQKKSTRDQASLPKLLTSLQNALKDLVNLTKS